MPAESDEEVIAPTGKKFVLNKPVVSEERIDEAIEGLKEAFSDATPEEKQELITESVKALKYQTNGMKTSIKTLKDTISVKQFNELVHTRESIEKQLERSDLSEKSILALNLMSLKLQKTIYNLSTGEPTKSVPPPKAPKKTEPLIKLSKGERHQLTANIVLEPRGGKGAQHNMVYNGQHIVSSTPLEIIQKARDEVLASGIPNKTEMLLKLDRSRKSALEYIANEPIREAKAKAKAEAKAQAKADKKKAKK